MARSIVLHEDFTAVNAKHAEHVLLQHFYLLIAIHFFVFRQEIQASSSHFPIKSFLYHDWIRVLYSWDCKPWAKSIRSIMGRRTIGDPTRNTWKLLSSENITFFHCAGVQWMYFFANAMRCFFIRSIKSGFLAALRQGKPKSFCRRCCMVRTATFSSTSGCRFFSSRAVSRGFFCTSLFIKVPVAFDVFFFLPPPNLCLGTLLGGSPLVEARNFITVDWLFHYEHTFL